MSSSDADLIAQVLKRQPRAIARMMSRAESATPEDRKALADIFRLAGKAHVIGITGVPGSGKSTLVRSLTLKIRESGRTVGIVAVDPSSGGALGGLARPALDTVDVLDAAGFDVVLIETVGVGQDEVDIVSAAHTVVVVSAPGLGDEIQAIKAGVLEIADIHAVSKCDRDDAARTVADLQAMLGLGRGDRRSHGWTPPVVPTSAETGGKIDVLLQAIDDHLAHLIDSGEMALRQRCIAEMRILKAAEDEVRALLQAQRQGRLAHLIEQTVERTLAPHSAALQLLDGFRD